MTASVIVPVRNRATLIKRCLHSLSNQTLKDFEIIVINDASSDGTRKALKQFSKDPRISIIDQPEPSGPAAARNRAIRQSQGSFIALIDSDCEAAPQWLEELIRPFLKDPSIMITAGKMNTPEASTYWALVNKGENHIRKGSGFTDRAIGCNMALRRSFAERNPFDETLRAAASEDTGLCLACVRENKKIFYTERAQVVHYQRSTIVSTLHQAFNYGYYNACVRFKHKAPPYISYGAWILVAAVSLGISSAWTGRELLRQAALASWLLYAGLVLYINVRPGQKTLAQLAISYPGMLVRCLADSLGSLLCAGASLNYAIAKLSDLFRRSKQHTLP